jgi:hypothetical protein
VIGRIGKFLVVVALVAMLGAHWTLLQSVAWTAMLADNLHSTSLHEALVKTFDGKHPCCLCKQIAAGKKSEKKSEFTLQGKQSEFLMVTPRFIFAAPTHFWRLIVADNLIKSVCHTPPVPPPRAAFV